MVGSGVGVGSLVGVGGWIDCGCIVAVGSGVLVCARVVGVGVGRCVVGVSLAGGGGESVTVSGVTEVRRQASNPRPNSKKIERQRASFLTFIYTSL